MELFVVMPWSYSNNVSTQHLHVQTNYRNARAICEIHETNGEHMRKNVKLSKIDKNAKP